MVNMRKLQSPLYSRDIITIKEYQDKDKTFYKLVYHSCLRNSGVEKTDEEKQKDKENRQKNLNCSTFKEIVKASQFLQDYKKKYKIMTVDNFQDFKKEYFDGFTADDFEGFTAIFGTLGDGLRFTEKEIIDYIEKQEKGKDEQTIQRARNTIFEYAACNDFEFFVTLTLADDKVKNRDDLEGSYKVISQWFRDYKKKHKDFLYLLIAEKHKSGVGWHFHGLVNGIPPDDLKKFEIGQKMSKRMAQLVRDGRTLYSWTPWESKFGFNDVEYIRNKEAVEKYITKYCSKDLGTYIKEQNAHLYYCSKGLKKAKLIAKGTYSGEIDAHDADFFDYVGDYCSAKIIKSKDEMLRLKDLLFKKNIKYFDDFSLDVDTGEILAL